jgi:hypothetical protein
MPQTEHQVENDPTEAWRLHVLLDAGYPLQAAELLAVARGVDLHQAVYLLEAGCDPQLALEILT